jgi:3-hexulose-6-phosphate synthase
MNPIPREERSMQLQIAFDRMPLERATEIVRSTAEHADWIEVGTSLIKQYGMEAVRQIGAAADGIPVLADLKTADDAAFEFALAFDAGAASATVLALADDASIDTAVRVAAERGREVVVDLMNVPATRREALAGRLPDSVVFAAHIGKDAQGSGADPAALLGHWARGRHVAVAGGLTVDRVAALDSTSRSGAAGIRVIVGSAITGASDAVEAARNFRRAIENTGKGRNA